MSGEKLKILHLENFFEDFFFFAIKQGDGTVDGRNCIREGCFLFAVTAERGSK